jgi:hypothetical protein
MVGLTCAAPATVSGRIIRFPLHSHATGRLEQAPGKALEGAPPARIPANTVVARAFQGCAAVSPTRWRGSRLGLFVDDDSYENPYPSCAPYGAAVPAPLRAGCPVAGVCPGARAQAQPWQRPCCWRKTCAHAVAARNRGDRHAHRAAPGRPGGRRVHRGPRNHRSSGATGLADVLARLPGWRFRATAALGNASSVFLRGAESRFTAVYIDGVRMDSQSTGGAQWEQIPLSQIDRIEVLRGPAARSMARTPLAA